MKKTTKKISSKIADDEYVKSKNKKKHKFDVWSFIFVVNMSVITTAGATFITSKETNEKVFSDVNTQLFQKTNFNVPVFLPIKNGVVNLNIVDCFNEKQLSKIKAGIEKLDFDAKGIEFNVTFSDDNIKKAINIRSFDGVNDDYRRENTYAYAEVNRNNYTARISYPLTIYMNTEEIEYYRADYNSIIRHELMHCLGFTDLSNKSVYGDYLMYSCGSTYYKDLASDEYDALNKVYSPERTGLVKVEKPTDIKYSYVEKDCSVEMTKDEEDTQLIY